MIIAHKIALKLNVQQRIYCARSAGTARFAWNWALNEWKQSYEAGEKVSEAGLRKRLNAIKREQFPWMLDVTKVAPQQAIKNLGTAFTRFFTGKSKYPQPKRKGQHDSFRADNGPGTFKVTGRRLKLPVVGTLKLREELRFTGKPMSVTISREADRWFASIAVEVEHTPPTSENQAVCGVDLGISRLATISDGTFYQATHALRREIRKLRRGSRRLSRKQKGSKNRAKSKHRLAKLHARIVHVRRDSLHKLTTDLTRRFSTVVIEDLNVKGMMANRKLARAVADVGMYEFRRQLSYKAEMQGVRVVVADRFFPSSQLCSTVGCEGRAVGLGLAVRSWTCSDCNTTHDRDLNAAKNLERYSTVSSTGINACGAGSSVAPGQPGRRSPALKQESYIVINDYI